MDWKILKKLLFLFDLLSRCCLSFPWANCCKWNAPRIFWYLCLMAIFGWLALVAKEMATSEVEKTMMNSILLFKNISPTDYFVFLTKFYCLNFLNFKLSINVVNKTSRRTNKADGISSGPCVAQKCISPSAPCRMSSNWQIHTRWNSIEFNSLNAIHYWFIILTPGYYGQQTITNPQPLPVSEWLFQDSNGKFNPHSPPTPVSVHRNIDTLVVAPGWIGQFISKTQSAHIQLDGYVSVITKI